MRQAVTRFATRLRPAGPTFVLALLLPATAGALTSPTLRDLADPVPPGGVLPYRITLRDVTPDEAEGPPVPFCFNPPAECVATPVTCDNPLARCVGNETAGFVCQDSLNDLANCGEGTPPVPNEELCIDRESGTCNGGNHIGLECFALDGALTAECPGTTFVCRRSVNEDEYCGNNVPPPAECVGDSTTGFFCQNAKNEGASCNAVADDPEDAPEPDLSLCEPLDLGEPRPDNSYCLSRPTGICSGGPNVGLVCDTPHGQPSDQCPPLDPGVPPPAPANITVELPILPGMTFLDADNGGASNGTTVTWTVPPLTACGVPNTPRCPELNARMSIDPLVVEGTVYENQATATDQDGFLVSQPHRTTIARFLLKALTLSYPAQVENRDRFAYRTLFTLLPSETIVPGSEDFTINVSNADGTIVEFTLPAGLLGPSTVNGWTYSSPDPGLKNVRLRQISPGHFSLRVRGARLSLPAINSGSLDVTVTLTFGDDTLSHDARLLIKRGGRRYIAARSTSTTTIISPPTTSTSLPGATTTSTSLPGTSTTSTSLAGTTTTSTTLDTTTTSTTLDTTTTSTTLDTTTTSTTLDTTTTSTTLDTTTTSTTFDPSTTSSSTSSTSSTTSTTLLPCGGLVPACSGDCPIGQTCTGANIGDPCTCQ